MWCQNQTWRITMNIDEEKIDETVLALLQLTLHDEYRTWKGQDINAMNRLFETMVIK